MQRSNSPVHHQRRLPAVGVDERRRGKVGGREGEVGRLDDRRVATAAAAEALVEPHPVVLQPPRDRRPAATDPLAGAVGQQREVAVLARGPAHGGVRRDVVRVADVGERLAAEHGELVGGVGEPEDGALQVHVGRRAVDLHFPGGGVVAVGGDVVQPPDLAVVQRDLQHLLVDVV